MVVLNGVVDRDRVLSAPGFIQTLEDWDPPRVSEGVMGRFEIARSPTRHSIKVGPNFSQEPRSETERTLQIPDVYENTTFVVRPRGPQGLGHGTDLAAKGPADTDPTGGPSLERVCGTVRVPAVESVRRGARMFPYKGEIFLISFSFLSFSSSSSYPLSLFLLLFPLPLFLPPRFLIIIYTLT